MTSLEPPFTSVAIVGLGLIGGSVALGIRERWPGVRIVGVDRAAVLAHAADTIDRGVESISEIGEPDLVVLAAPVRQNVALLAELATRRLRQETVVTDVGGTKRDIVEAARQASPCLTFVGGHPIGGAERGGFSFAHPKLFDGRPWILTPDADTSLRALAAVEALARGLGARPTTMSAAEHDRLMAFVSHLPQLTASALMHVAGASTSGSGLRLAGRGLVDTTRLASSPADVWVDICGSNADAIGEALDHLISRLMKLRADLKRGEVVAETFVDAAHWRNELMKGRD